MTHPGFDNDGPVWHRRRYVAMLVLACAALFTTSWCVDASEPDVPALAVRVEPSVVAILVVRGEPYAEPPPHDLGRLGAFPSTPSERQVAARKPELAPHHPGFVPSYVAGGAVVDRAGLVLTLYHVVRGARKIYVLGSDGRQGYADILAADPRSDWAVLQLLSLPSPWPAVPLGEAESLRKGEGLISLETPPMAMPRQPDFAVSWSRLARRSREPEDGVHSGEDPVTPSYFGAVLHGDGRLLTAHSGGVVCNGRGELVGLTNQLLTTRLRDGMPIQGIDDVARRIIHVLLRGEEVEYGFLGVTTRGVRVAVENDTAATGVEVASEVLDGMPAARAQLRPGDVILRVGGRTLRGNANYTWAIAPAMAGKSVDLAISRQGRLMDVRVDRLDKLPPLPGVIATNRPPAFKGLRIDYLTTLIGHLPPERLDWQERLLATLADGGVVIREVLPGSPADRAGLRIQELITHVNDRPVAAPSEFLREVANVDGPVVFTVRPLDPQSPPRKLRIE